MTSLQPIFYQEKCWTDVGVPHHILKYTKITDTTHPGNLISLSTFFVIRALAWPLFVKQIFSQIVLFGASFSTICGSDKK